ncbi:hypothetical protein Lalb_Chr03g0041381 [Lupinus albus]|uniref:Uncharacterized protein n=1 Tax=Lupinus albus TaxID=3870 RepID=A0A6A4QUD1_LUPAL|nr:hypothetical protein Lalb_Chr03g0041381 [Lupinus albus]
MAAMLLWKKKDQLIVAIAELDSQLEGYQVTGAREQEGVVETMEMAEAMAVVVTLTAGGIMDIGMAIGEDFQAVVAMVGIREMILWEPMVAEMIIWEPVVAA